MVGGKIIENVPKQIEGGKHVRRLWVMDTNGDECCVYADWTAVHLQCGDAIWWQGGKIYAHNDTISFVKFGYSFSTPAEEMR